MASSSKAVQEMFVKKSADYAGRQQTYFLDKFTLGKQALSLKCPKANFNYFEFIAS